MSIVQPGGSADIPVIEDGLYQAVVKSVADKTLEQPDAYGNSEKVVITINFRDTDGAEQTLDPQVNRKWGEKATLFAIANACGCNVHPDAPFDTDDLVGKRVNVLVETPEEGKWPRIQAWTKAAKPKNNPQEEPRQAGPAWIAETGDVDWKAWWAITERYGATKQSIAAKVGGLDKLETMSFDALADVLEDLKV